MHSHFNLNLSADVDDLIYDAMDAQSLLDDERSSAKDVYSEIYDTVWFKHHTSVCENFLDYEWNIEIRYLTVWCS